MINISTNSTPGTDYLCSICFHPAIKHHNFRGRCLVSDCTFKCMGYVYIPTSELKDWEVTKDQNINPVHYTQHPSGVECIQITEHLNFCLGNAIKYIWRVGLKSESDAIEDLMKARWYLDREISRRELDRLINLPTTPT